MEGRYLPACGRGPWLKYQTFKLSKAYVCSVMWTAGPDRMSLVVASDDLLESPEEMKDGGTSPISW